jgi:hypothetical protein
MKRRDFLNGALGAGLAGAAFPFRLQALPEDELGFRLTDVTSQAGIVFHHNTGAYGGKLLPETLGSGCAFLDYDGDGWQDILLINSMDWPGHKRQRSTMRLYRNNRNGTFTDVTRRAGLDVELYGMGVAVGDYDNDGYPDIFITCVGQNRLFHNTGRGTFVDVTRKSGLHGRQAFSTSALWFDYDRDGLLDLFVCNYVNWSPEHDVFCSLDGKHKSYCTPEAYRGETCWLFRNRGNGTFEDVTAASGVFDTSSKSLGVAMFDYDNDGWPDLLVANDTQPNKLYRNLRNGKFKDVAIEAGLAFSADGKARAGMGVDTGDIDGSGKTSVAITNFDNEMMGLYQEGPSGAYEDVSMTAGVGAASKNTLGFGCCFLDLNLDGLLDLVVANGHIDETVRNIRGNVGYAQPPHLFLNEGGGKFKDLAAEAGNSFARPKVGRGLAFADFDRDGDLDLLLTTNNGPAYLYRNDALKKRSSIRLHLRGTKSNRDAIGAKVRIFYNGRSQVRLVRSGSSYLSQSELAVTFGLGGEQKIERMAVEWPSGFGEEHKDLEAGKAYQVTEKTGVTALYGF